MSVIVCVLMGHCIAPVDALGANMIQSGEGSGVSRGDGRNDYVVKDKIEPGFYRGAFIGDGVSGAMVYKDPEAPRGLRWLMGRYDLIAHSAIAKTEYCVPRLFAGDILLVPVGETRRETLRMELEKGQASGSIETDQGTISWRSYVHRTLGVFVVEVKGTGAESGATLRVREQWGVSPVFLHKKIDPETFEKRELLPPKPATRTVDDVTLISQPLRSLGAHAVAWKVRTINPETRILFAAIGAVRDDKLKMDELVSGAERQAIENLSRVDKVSLAEMDRTHQSWWRDYMNLSRLELPDDPAWEQFWWRQIYKFAAASSEESHWLIDTQGPWIYNSAWSAVWWNLNIQLSYYPALISNRLGVGRSLLNGMDRLQKSGVLNRNAGKHSADSIWIGRSTDQFGGGTWGDEYGNLTWVLQTMWRYWRHSGDDAIARQVFALLRQDVNYYLHALKEGPDGKLHMPPTRSPEYSDVTAKLEGKRELYADCNYAIASLHWALTTLVDLDEHLGTNDPLREKWQSTKARLVQPPAGEHGLKIGADQDYIDSHRHYSHLLAIYPYHIINPDQGPEATELIRKSVDHWTSMPKAFAGYSYTGAAAMYATLGDSEKAIFWLDKLLPRCEPNSLYQEGGGQVIETPLSAVDSVGYLLLQCWGDKVRLFPAVPSRWRNVAFDDFSAEGAFLVSARRRDGVTQTVQVKSLAGKLLRLQTDSPLADFDIRTSGGTAHRVVGTTLLEAKLGKDETLTLTRRQSGAQPPVSR